MALGSNDTDQHESDLELLDLAALSRSVREKRVAVGPSTRKAGELAGVSFMTLRRIEHGGFPDLATYLRLCAWLEVPPEEFFLTGAVRKQSTPDVVAKVLLSDPLLTLSDASQIASVVRSLHGALASESQTDEPVAAHLCAPLAMRRGMPERLSALMLEMRTRLVEGAPCAAASLVQSGAET